MTKKEFNRLEIWIKEQKGKANCNYMMVFPSGINYIKNPSQYQSEQSKKSPSIFISVSNIISIKDNNIVFRSSWDNLKYSIPYNHIQRIYIYNY